jgi:hypothetical protein
MNWIPSPNIRYFQWEGDDDQHFKIRALSHPRTSEPLVVIVDLGNPTPINGVYHNDTYTVEYRQADGWDLGIGTDGNVPQSVRSKGGAVFVHQYLAVSGRPSTLINGAYAGALLPCNTMILGNGARYITVDDFDLADGSANVSIGFGSGHFKPCVLDSTRAEKPQQLHHPMIHGGSETYPAHPPRIMKPYAEQEPIGIPKPPK